MHNRIRLARGFFTGIAIAAVAAAGCKDTTQVVPPSRANI